MFTRQSAEFYDLVYESRGRNYSQEATEIQVLVDGYKKSAGNALLDVACGTGAHLPHLRKWYNVMGLDLNEDMLRVARQRCPDVEFHCGDMADFELGQTFDVIICLFSSIAYVKTLDRLHETLQTFGRHLNRGGLIIVEPWYTPATYTPNTINLAEVNFPNLQIVRVNASRLEAGQSVIDLHYFVATK